MVDSYYPDEFDKYGLDGKKKAKKIKAIFSLFKFVIIFAPAMTKALYKLKIKRRCGRAVDCSGLENRRT